MQTARNYRSVISIMIGVLFIFQLFVSQAVLADDGTPGEIVQPEVQVTAEPPDSIEEIVLPDAGDMPVEMDIVVLDETGEPLALASETAVQVLRAPDPYLTSGGVLYTFTADDCDPLTDGAQACGNPIQSAINFAGLGGYTPDDGTIYVESGEYNENIIIGLMNNFQLLGVSGSSVTVLNGSVTMHDNYNISLRGFTIYGEVLAAFNSGELDIEDLVVDGSNGESGGILIIDQAGSVKINKVHSKNSWFNGLQISSFRFGDSQNQPSLQFELQNPSIYIANSSFNNNWGNGIYIENNGSVNLANVQANYNGNNGAYISNRGRFPDISTDKNALQLPMGINNTVIKNGEFVGNGVLRLDANLEGINQGFDINQRNGLYIFGDNIELKGVLSSANGNNGAVLITPEYYTTDDFSEPVGTKIKVVCSSFNNNGNFGIQGSTNGDIVHKSVTTHSNGEGDVNYEHYNSFVHNADFICHKVTEDIETPLNDYNIPCTADGLTLQLENKDMARFTGFCNHDGKLIAGNPASLPGAAPDGTQYGSALEAAAYLDGAYVDVLPAGGSIQVEFFVPEELQGKELSILFWDAGKNAWVEIPVAGSEGEFDPSDASKQALAGASMTADGYFSASVNFSGIFMLVAK